MINNKRNYLILFTFFLITHTYSQDQPNIILINMDNFGYPWTPDKGGVFWVRWPMAEILNEHGLSLQKETPIKAGTPDPYEQKN